MPCLAARYLLYPTTFSAPRSGSSCHRYLRRPDSTCSLETPTNHCKPSTKSRRKKLDYAVLIRGRNGRSSIGRRRSSNHFKAHIELIHAALADNAVAAVQSCREEVKALEEAAHLVAQAFRSEPLPGVGTSPWKELWDSARRYSESFAYPNSPFPAVSGTSRCVLCQQSLGEEARHRFTRFEQFVTSDTQVRLLAARTKWDTGTNSLIELQTAPEDIAALLKDLEADHSGLVGETRSMLAEYEAGRDALVRALPGPGDLPRLQRAPDKLGAQLEAAARKATAAGESLSSPEKVAERLSSVVAKRRELELLRDVRKEQEAISKEIARLRERVALEAVKNAAATGPITNKVSDLAKESITAGVRENFDREIQRLRVEQVTMAMTRLDEGAVLHQPKLVGAQQDVAVTRVLSEGERTALGLAAFFTEASLNPRVPH